MKQSSWLYSDSFLKRAFAVWGHATVANLIIAIPLLLLQMIGAMLLFSNMRMAP